MEYRIRSERWLIPNVKEAVEVYNVSSEQFSGHTKQGFGLTGLLLWRMLLGTPYSLRAEAHLKVEMRRGKFETPHRKFDLPRSKFETPRIKLDARHRKFETRHRKFDLPRLKFETAHRKFETPRFKFQTRHLKLETPRRKFQMSRFKCATRHCTLEIRRLSGVLARKKSFPSAKMETESRSLFR